jgi:single-strand DNA-binding protein
MANFTSVVVVGRLTRDPELAYATTGSPVCHFTVATSRRYTKQDGQKVEQTTFLDVDAWKRLAEQCQQFLKKGRQVLVMGSLQQDRWTDSKTQQPRSKIKLVAQQVQFLDSRREGEDPEPADEAAGHEANGKEEPA